MRIGIDAHILVPKHKRYDPQIARYTENLIKHILDSPQSKEHTWVLFFDERMSKASTKKFERKNVIIKRFPFVQYRRYLPVVYSHMLISSFIRSAKLDLFHSPEGLIPFVYPGKIVATFHYVPRGKLESNLFVRTFMLGARVAFAQLCRKASRIIVDSTNDKKLLVERHGYPEKRVVVMEADNLEQVAWPERVKNVFKVYETVVNEKSAPAKAPKKKSTPKKAKKATKSKNKKKTTKTATKAKKKTTKKTTRKKAK